MIKKITLLYSKHPFVGNVFVYGGLYGAGDLSQQCISGSKNDKTNWKSAKNTGIIGGSIFGPLYHTWYRFLDSKFPGSCKRIVVRKIILDQLLLSAPCILVFYLACGYLEKKKNIIEDSFKKVPKTLATGLLYWPTVQAVNFSFIPSHLRAVYVAGGFFIWINILSSMKKNDPLISSPED